MEYHFSVDTMLGYDKSIESIISPKTYYKKNNMFGIEFKNIDEIDENIRKVIGDPIINGLNKCKLSIYHLAKDHIINLYDLIEGYFQLFIHAYKMCDYNSLVRYDKLIFSTYKKVMDKIDGVQEVINDYYLDDNYTLNAIRLRDIFRYQLISKYKYCYINRIIVLDDSVALCNILGLKLILEKCKITDVPLCEILKESYKRLPWITRYELATTHPWLSVTEDESCQTIREYLWLKEFIKNIDTNN